MRLVDADELLEHIYRDRLDSRKLISDMIENAHTVYAIPISYIDKQIDRYYQLFEKNLYENDEYDDHYRIMVDTLKLLKKRWEKRNERSDKN